MDGKLELGEFTPCYQELCAIDIGTDPNSPCTGYTAEEVFTCYDTAGEGTATTVASLDFNEFKAIGEAVISGTFMDGCSDSDGGDDDTQPDTVEEHCVQIY